MGSKRASLAGLLLLALALIICAVQMVKAAYGDDTVKRMARRSLLNSVYGDQPEPPATAYGDQTEPPATTETTTTGSTTGTTTTDSTTSSATSGNITTSSATSGNITTGSTSGNSTTSSATSDPACAALGCEPGGKCEVDGNGERYCKWDSPCGACPTGATCKTVPLERNVSVQVPYCECPAGYGMTATECVAGGNSTVGWDSITLIANPAAKDNTSRPYTLRLNPNGCTQFPTLMTGKAAYYFVYMIGTSGRMNCRIYNHYNMNNCEGKLIVVSSGLGTGKPYWPDAAL
ncbi:unnamed protein product, partial [Closterium sp. Naga37s-1]